MRLHKLPGKRQKSLEIKMGARKTVILKITILRHLSDRVGS